MKGVLLLVYNFNNNNCARTRHYSTMDTQGKTLHVVWQFIFLERIDVMADSSASPKFWSTYAHP